MNNTKTKLLSGLSATLLLASLFAGCGTANAASSAVTVPDAAAPAPTATAAPSPIAGKEISVITREDGSGTRSAFIELFGVQEKGADGKKVDHTTVEATIVNKTDVMLTTVAGDPTAIGYLSLGSMNSSVKALKIEGVAATAENMLSGAYQISRPFNIATKGAPTGLTKDFIDFILSAEGQKVVSGSYLAIDSSAPAYAGQQPSGKLTIGGSSSVFPVMEKLQEAYQVLNPNAKLELQSIDSTAGMTGAISGIFDIGMASRELTDTEKATLTPVTIAIDGLAVIVHPQSPVENLTKDTVKGIFTGSILSWDEIK